MQDNPRTILVTSALPYASGPIHIGHLVEYAQTDIWVRFHKLLGRRCLFVCATDAHGTPVMLRARKEGIRPEELVERLRIEHEQNFKGFHVAFDNYYTTHSEENRELVETIYARLNEQGLIHRKTILQAYDTEAGMFLPDRFVRGTCPACGAKDQYGDNCEVCSATYTPDELIDPRSAISDTTPVKKESEHYFFKLGEFEALLRQWLSSGHVDDSVRRKLNEWFETGLRDWDISRDEPYFGFRIPGTTDKYFYVWLDAPVGYLASFRNLCDSPRGRQAELEFDSYFGADSTAELYHFIGKDIIYFHTLFWPAVLEGAGFRKPTGVFAHGFLTVNGQKMSKSRGTFISAGTYLEFLDPDCLRYYYAFKLGPGIEDIDLNLDDFINRVNSDLVGKFVNIASRNAGFINKRFDGQLAERLDDEALYAEFVDAGDGIAEYYEQREFGKAMRAIMKLADRANRYIDTLKPWVLAKNEERLPEVQRVCTQGLNLFRVLMIYLKPVVPGIAAKAEAFLGAGPPSWQDRGQPLLATRINAFTPLLTRMDPATIDAMVEAARQPDPEP